MLAKDVRKKKKEYGYAFVQNAFILCELANRSSHSTRLPIGKPRNAGI